MKTATNIFAIYMLVLSVVPCGDGGGGIVEIANHLFGIEQQDDPGHEQHSGTCDDDLCSPFCICSCCSMVFDIIKKMPFQIKMPASAIKEKPSFVPNISPSIYYSSFWQPPRFC